MLDRETVHAIFENQRDRPPTRWQKVFMAGYLLVGLAALALTLVFGWKHPSSNPWLILGVAVPYLLLWLWFRRDLHNDRVCARMMLDALNDGGKQLAWVYVEEVRGAYEAKKLHYRFTNRRHGEFVGTEEMLSALFTYITTHIPHISYGYAAELEQRFRRNPPSLKTEPVRGNAIQETYVPYDASSNGW